MTGDIFEHRGWIGQSPLSSNADEWLMFLEENKEHLPFVAVKIAEAIEAQERRSLEHAMRAVEEIRFKGNIFEAALGKAAIQKLIDAATERRTHQP